MSRSLEPTNITKADWYYEEPSHMLFVHQVFEANGDYLRTDTVKIPWKKIEASLKRIKARKRRLTAHQ